ncbi:MAG: hypothetical protein GY769_09920, partial [bacterium]|nr:hypothetical protein [bacterium]
MKRSLGNTLVVGLVAVLAVAGAYSAAADEIASMEPRGGLLAFRSISSEGMTLTVAGPGYRKTERFRSGQMPSFTPVDAEGYMLPDGIYTWELAENPRLQGAPTVAWDKPANGRLTHRAPRHRRR